VPVALKALGESAETWDATPVLGPRTPRPDGRFTFETVPAGEYRIVAWIGGHYHVFAERVRVEEGRSSTVLLALDPDRSIAGRAVDAAGAPISNVRLAIAGLPDTARTDHEGRFEMVDLPRGAHRIVARHDRCPGAAVAEEVVTGRRDVVIRMPRAPCASGRVFLASSGRPASSFWIRVLERDESGVLGAVRHPFVDVEGRFELPLPARAFAVEAGTDRGLASRRVIFARPVRPGEPGPVLNLYLENEGGGGNEVLEEGAIGGRPTARSIRPGGAAATR